MQTIDYQSPWANRTDLKRSVVPIVVVAVLQIATAPLMAFVILALSFGYAGDTAIWAGLLSLGLGVTTLLYLIRRLPVGLIIGVGIAILVVPAVHLLSVGGIEGPLWLLPHCGIGLLGALAGMTYRKPVEQPNRTSAQPADVWGNPL